MAYGQYPGYGYGTYSGMQPNPYMQRLNDMMQQSQPPMQAQRYEIIHVNGENGAKSFRMAPNSQCLLLDDTAPIVWLCVSDGAGYHTTTPYKIEPYQGQNEKNDMQAVYGRISALEKEISEIKSGMPQTCASGVSEMKPLAGMPVSSANAANPGNGNP